MKKFDVFIPMKHGFYGEESFKSFTKSKDFVKRMKKIYSKYKDCCIDYRRWKASHYVADVLFYRACGYWKGWLFTKDNFQTEYCKAVIRKAIKRFEKSYVR